MSAQGHRGCLYKHKTSATHMLLAPIWQAMTRSRLIRGLSASWQSCIYITLLSVGFRTDNAQRCQNLDMLMTYI